MIRKILSRGGSSKQSTACKLWWMMILYFPAALQLAVLSDFKNLVHAFQMPILLRGSVSTKYNDLHPHYNQKWSLKMSMDDENDYPSVSTTDSKVELSPTIERDMEAARALKKRAEKERLEADRLNTELILEKIANLEKKIQSSKNDKDFNKKESEWRQSIDVLQKQLNSDSSKDAKNGRKSSSTTTLSSSSSIERDSSVFDSSTSKYVPTDVLKRRMDAYQKFSSPVKSLYARATGVSDMYDAESIIRKAYAMEQERNASPDKNVVDATSKDLLLIIANAQAGYETLPEPIQNMVAESIGMNAASNATEIVEKLVMKKKVTPSGDGGVEFCMDDPENNEKRGTDREFTKEEVVNAESLYESLPEPMKVMLAKSVQEDSTLNSTLIVQKMIEQKKMLPSEEGVEFVVSGNDDTILDFDGAGDRYVESLLPKVTRKEGQSPNEEDVNVLFTQVLGRRTFNPISKPEKIPGGYIIRGESKLKDGDELIAEIEKELLKTSASGKMKVFYIRDPTLISDEQFESESYELPVLMVLGPDLSPDTNRLVKPIVSIFGGLSISAVAVAACLSTDLNMDMGIIEDMTGALTLAIVGTQAAHEAAHQIVALKDKFRAGVPTVIPSIQLGFEGCITPLITPPKNLKSLFDFALAGPMVGMCISLLLMYSGLEKQVFMDAASQANLPSLPVNLVRASSLAGGIIEWLLGEGTLYSADPNALIRLHPFAIAGFIGIVTNAFSLLPIGNTDGGRIALTIFGRGFLRFVRSLTLGLLILAGLFGSDQADLLIVYAIIAQIWMRETEIPCKNEVDGLDDGRLVLASLVAFIVALAVVPLPL